VGCGLKGFRWAGEGERKRGSVNIANWIEAQQRKEIFPISYLP
jgi:hypothetical protein